MLSEGARREVGQKNQKTKLFSFFEKKLQIPCKVLNEELC